MGLGVGIFLLAASAIITFASNATPRPARSTSCSALCCGLRGQGRDASPAGPPMWAVNTPRSHLRRWNPMQNAYAVSASLARAGFGSRVSTVHPGKRINDHHDASLGDAVITSERTHSRCR